MQYNTLWVSPEGRPYTKDWQICADYDLDLDRFRDLVWNGCDIDAIIFGAESEPMDWLDVIGRPVGNPPARDSLQLYQGKPIQEDAAPKAKPKPAPLFSDELCSEHQILDHLGNEYATIWDLCDAYHTDERTFAGRVSHGWTVEQALTTPTGKLPKGCVRDHTGRLHPSLEAMCAAWSIDEGLYRRRRAIGWSKEKALTARQSKRAKPQKKQSDRSRASEVRTEQKNGKKTQVRAPRGDQTAQQDSRKTARKDVVGKEPRRGGLLKTIWKTIGGFFGKGGAEEEQHYDPIAAALDEEGISYWAVGPIFCFDVGGLLCEVYPSDPHLRKGQYCSVVNSPDRKRAKPFYKRFDTAMEAVEAAIIAANSAARGQFRPA